MTIRPMQGIRILEVATWGVGPVSAAVLADWGAEVIKVEHPKGDPLRLFTTGALAGGSGTPAFDATWQQAHRGKRGIAVDVATERGRSIILSIAAHCDIFLTSFLPSARRRLGIDVEDIRAVNPTIVYVRASAFGPRGPEADKGGYDATAYWFRSGASTAATAEGDEWPRPEPVGAFGDYPTSMMLAGGISAALLHRQRTGEPCVVDGSLYGCGIWTMGYGLIGNLEHHGLTVPDALRRTYRTKDDRYVDICLLEPQWWPSFCQGIGQPELEHDERFVDAKARRANAQELMAIAEEAFASRPLAEWREALQVLEGPWAYVANREEVLSDPQAIANEFLTEVVADDGVTKATVVSAPIQFNESAPKLTRAPEHGEHTDAVLRELDLGADEIAALRADKVIL